MRWHVLLHSVCNLKAIEMNIQASLIQELLLFGFEVGHNAEEATKNIFATEVKFGE